MKEDSIEIFVPSSLDVTNIHEVFNQVQGIISGDDTYDELILNTMKLQWVEPDGIVALAALMKLAKLKKHADKLVVRRHKNLSNAELYLCRMDFFKVLNFNIDYPYQRKDSSGNLCELIQVDKEEDVKTASHRIISILEHKFDDNVTKVTGGIATAIEEVMFNVFHHSESEVPCYICAQSYTDKVVIAVVDCGIGYKTHLRRNYNHIETDTQAIEFALEKYISGNCQPEKRSNSGIGLYGTRRLVMKNRGKMAIYTGGGSYELINGEETYYSVPEWKGALISFTFMLDNPISMTDFYDDEIDQEDNYLDDLFYKE